MNVVCIRSYEVEKQYQQYYDNAKLRCDSVVHQKDSQLRDTYTQDWIRLLSSNINNK